VSRLKADLAVLKASQDDPTVRAATRPAPTKAADAEALRKRVIADKVDRINNYGRNPVIGKASL
jgi:hypothetical protein